MTKPNDQRRLRCAVYTRKSSQEGLELSFNSLQAQREACEAFIESQRHEGWTVLADAYDDGGFSGGTVERPALQTLLADIEAGKVDVIVVYKVDRLTRSLSDFAKIVDVLDTHGVSFVSITQQFNTTTSMGRLTLNVLLSFAQFEREVTGERIRDKFLASRKKGMWMGGHPPFGYDLRDKRLIINDREAGIVRHIYARYAETGSVRRVKAELDADGIRTKERISQTRTRWGGKPFAVGALYHMLANEVYIGMAVHKGKVYPGEHDAIIDDALWQKVQRVIESNRRKRRNADGAKDPSLLAGLLFDAEGERFTPSHAVKRGRRYRYYIERSLITRGRSPDPSVSTRGKRIAAREIEAIVVSRLVRLFGDNGELMGVLQGLEAGDIDKTIGAAASLHKELKAASPGRCREIITTLVRRVVLEKDCVRLEIRIAGLRQLLDVVDQGAETSPQDTHSLAVPFTLRRRGSELKLVIEGGADVHRGRIDPVLIKLIARAHDWMKLLTSGRIRSIKELTEREGLTGSYITRVMRLSFLAPDIVAAILEGRQPPDHTAKKLLRGIDLPVSWEEQRTILGFRPV